MSDSNAISTDFYRALWRWHFYAGLVVFPVFMFMALTGALYLFKDEFESAMYGSLMTVPSRANTTTPEDWVSAAEHSAGGRVAFMTPPAAANQPARLVVEAPAGVVRSVFVDPSDNHVLGVLNGNVLGRFDGGPFMGTVRRFHSLNFNNSQSSFVRRLSLGTNALVELVAGWGIVLVATGAFLWWPRGQGGGVVTIRGGPQKRVFWRDLHAVTGIFVGAIILFLAVTGMPWSAVWGQQVQRIVNEHSWGKPGAPDATDEHAGHAVESVENAVPWATRYMVVHGMHTQPTLSLNDMVARVEEAHLPQPYVLSIPADHTKVWSASYVPNKVRLSRTLYLDGTGSILRDVGYDQYGAVGKVTEMGVSIHVGREYGWISQAVMLAGCIGVWVLAISGLTMWWKRRPTGQLAIPMAPKDPRVYLSLAAVLVPCVVIYPLVGASIIVVLAVDVVVRRVATAVRPMQASRA